jgi:hypothetical protein
MKEISYGNTLRDKIRKELGGTFIKIADRATLGLPDYFYLNKGFAAIVETKQSDDKIWPLDPWDSINDLRQYENIKRLSKHVLSIYAIYYWKLKMSAIVTVPDLEMFKSFRPTLLGEGMFITKGHGLNLFKKRWNEYAGSAPRL